MYLNEVAYPPEITELEAANRRCTDPKKKGEILQEIKQCEMGYKGEKQLEYFLKLLSDKEFTVVNNLRLNVNNQYLEIDSVLITSNFVLLNDAKNYKGALYYDQILKQGWRTYKHETSTVSYHIAQAIRHQYQMHQFWKLKKLPPLPIIPLIVIAFTSTSISTNPGLEHTLNQYVLHAENLLERIIDLQNTYSKKALNTQQPKKIGQFLLSQHKPKPPYVLKKYQLTPKNLLEGVQCPSCSKFPMVWHRRKWNCPHCSATSLNAHEQAIQDYFTLIKPSLSNSECRDFLNLSSRDVAKSLLKKMDLRAKGKNKGAIYLPSQVKI